MELFRRPPSGEDNGVKDSFSSKNGNTPQRSPIGGDHPGMKLNTFQPIDSRNASSSSNRNALEKYYSPQVGSTSGKRISQGPGLNARPPLPSNSDSAISNDNYGLKALAANQSPRLGAEFHRIGTNSGTGGDTPSRKLAIFGKDKNNQADQRFKFKPERLLPEYQGNNSNDNRNAMLELNSHAQDQGWPDPAVSNQDRANNPLKFTDLISQSNVHQSSPPNSNFFRSNSHGQMMNLKSSFNGNYMDPSINQPLNYAPKRPEDNNQFVNQLFDQQNNHQPRATAEDGLSGSRMSPAQVPAKLSLNESGMKAQNREHAFGGALKDPTLGEEPSSKAAYNNNMGVPKSPEVLSSSHMFGNNATYQNKPRLILEGNQSQRGPASGNLNNLYNEISSPDSAAKSRKLDSYRQPIQAFAQSANGLVLNRNQGDQSTIPKSPETNRPNIFDSNLMLNFSLPPPPVPAPTMPINFNPSNTFNLNGIHKNGQSFDPHSVRSANDRTIL